MEWISVSTSKHVMLLHTSTWSCIVFSAPISRNMCVISKETQLRTWTFLKSGSGLFLMH